ncbi:unnamed protein product [Dicrocoelium dendriticum]|nr:unnamed protein product [Dicrocoelium dendriticum]
MAYLKILEHKFDAIDTNHDKKLSLKEITNFLQAFGFNERQARDFMKEFDTNNDGVISREEFSKACRNIKASHLDEAKMRRLFKLMDVDKSGKVDIAELKAYLVKQRADVYTEEVKEWIVQHDKDKDGKLNYEEFIDFVRSHL